ncbi:MAG: MRP family ATP-binding protein [Planctomycetota bacterium]|nr:MAG: MRP family ATP-binding protein [Planctomycetota bacterium]REK26765.1 MAG: MRP family ATP-binding protein [Planctomycetota bacterium]REK28305.1 MAG: MRP family ATP-binding protein [Planctomycetota bacterium]
MVNSMMTEAQVREALADVEDPEIGRPLADLGMIEAVAVDGGAVRVSILLPTPAYPGRERITEAVSSKLTEAESVEVDFSSRVRGKESGGKIGLSVKNIIAVGSGKGGVGKSTVSAAIACGLKRAGTRVGLLDADVYGPSIPHLMGASGQLTAREVTTPEGQVLPRIEPIEADGVKLLSIGFQIEKDQAVVWRGPMLHKQLTLFLQHTDWGELDYLVIDMPPGTGDVALSLSQMVQAAGAVVVCTPQEVALLDAIKAISMFHTVKIPVLGMVENMSGEIFGRGGTRAKAEELGVPFLGEIPCEAAVRVRGDEGRIADLYADDSPVRDALQHVCERTAIEVARRLLETPSMPTLELL